jgi:hypothetical protein
MTKVPVYSKTQMPKDLYFIKNGARYAGAVSTTFRLPRSYILAFKTQRDCLRACEYFLVPHMVERKNERAVLLSKTTRAGSRSPYSEFNLEVETIDAEESLVTAMMHNTRLFVVDLFNETADKQTALLRTYKSFSLETDPLLVVAGLDSMYYSPSPASLQQAEGNIIDNNNNTFDK